MCVGVIQVSLELLKSMIIPYDGNQHITAILCEYQRRLCGMWHTTVKSNVPTKFHIFYETTLITGGQMNAHRARGLNNLNSALRYLLWESGLHGWRRSE